MEQMWLDEKGKSDKESEGATENEAKLRQVYREMKMDWRQKKRLWGDRPIGMKMWHLKGKVHVKLHYLFMLFQTSMLHNQKKSINIWKKNLFIQWHVTKVTTGCKLKKKTTTKENIKVSILLVIYIPSFQLN